MLDTIVSPRVRSFDVDQGSLAVLVRDSAGAAVSGLSIGLAGPSTSLDEPTNDNGCVLWGYLTASSAYEISFARAGWVNPAGTSAGGGPATIVGDETTNAGYQFDRGAAIRANFRTKRPGEDRLISTQPAIVRVDNGTGAGFSRTYDIGTSDSLDTSASGLLFPFANSYVVYADNCLSAKPAEPTSVALTPGSTVQAADVRLPALNITVKDRGVNVDNATVRVVTQCGTTYERQTSGGLIDDPGFPYATSGMTLCATDGERKRVLTNRANADFDGLDVTLDVGTDGSIDTDLSTCP